ncbi:unnamed protein product [Colletotrichum noveboracense]|uniref:YCII-related domain-containing protein n=1 Tax=Colletotrichum noveboracense TaxID=2664923 RepID=A0A9W4S2Q3_9PEZI|nr:unnamed protein product [Colletotrichum noveboracense]
MYARTLTFALRTANMSLGAGAGARTMATRAPKEFLCIMPDKPNVLQARKQVKGVTVNSELGLRALGAMLERHPKEDATEACFRGSVVVYTAESPEDVKAIIENDVYATSGVWDLERMQIIPVSFVCD